MERYPNYCDPDLFGYAPCGLYCQRGWMATPDTCVEMSWSDWLPSSTVTEGARLAGWTFSGATYAGPPPIRLSQRLYGHILDLEKRRRNK